MSLSGPTHQLGIGRAARESLTERDLESFMTAGYLDTRVHALYDQIPALCYGPYSQNSHGFDERVSIASVKRITGTIALFIAEWCATEPFVATSTLITEGP